MRAQAQCLLSRKGVISPEARGAAQRRQAGERTATGADCAVDGEHQGAGMGKERPVPHDGLNGVGSGWIWNILQYY